MNVLVSIVIPVYNGAEYLEKTVNSILSQHYSNFELLLVNDGSSDNSKKIIDGLLLQDNRVKAFHKENGGVAAARNYGIDRAEGEFIAFCDQDDLWLPAKLTKQMQLFQNEKVGLVYCGSISYYSHLNKKNKKKLDNKYRGNVFDKLVQVNMFTCCTAIARKSLLQETQAFDDDRALMGVDDWLAWLKLALVCEFDFVAEHLAIHVFHDDNYSSNEEKMHKAELVCINKIEPLADKYDKSVDWQGIKQNLHIRYANAYIYNGLFNLAGDTLLQASSLKGSRNLKLKGWLLKLIPSFIWRLFQNIKRAV